MLVPRLVLGTLLVAALATAGGYWWVRGLYAPHRDVREVLGWLPEDTETVSCVEGPWRLEQRDLSAAASLADHLDLPPDR
jgi:hypothetical protein